MFSGLLTRVEIGHIRIKSAGKGRHQVARIGLLAQPTRVVPGPKRPALRTQFKQELHENVQPYCCSLDLLLSWSAL
jgi:hypothetical protein